MLGRLHENGSTEQKKQGQKRLCFFIFCLYFAVMTDQQKLKDYKTLDIINPVSFVSGADFCYFDFNRIIIKLARL